MSQGAHSPGGSSIRRWWSLYLHTMWTGPNTPLPTQPHFAIQAGLAKVNFEKVSSSSERKSSKTGILSTTFDSTAMICRSPLVLPLKSIILINYFSHLSTGAHSRGYCGHIRRILGSWPTNKPKGQGWSLMPHIRTTFCVPLPSGSDKITH